MNVLIKNMEMPKCCAECDAEGHYENSYGDEYGFFCPFGYKAYTSETRELKRLDDCPLAPVPPHGRLGDLDKLIEKIDGIWDCNDMVFRPNDHCCNVPEDCKGCKWIETKNFIRRMVANAQTIIPAEPSKEE